MSTRTAIASLQPERAAQFRTLLDDCLAGLGQWIQSTRSSRTPPAPRVFSQLALALDRLVTVAARIEPAGIAPTNASTPGNAEPKLGTSSASARPPAPSASAPAQSAQPSRPAPPVPSIKSIPSMVTMLSARAAPRAPHPPAAQSAPRPPAAPPSASPPTPPTASPTASIAPLASSPPAAAPRPSSITAALVRKRRRKK